MHLSLSWNILSIAFDFINSLAWQQILISTYIVNLGLRNTLVEFEQNDVGDGCTRDALRFMSH